MTKDFAEKLENITRRHGVKWKGHGVHDAFRLYCAIRDENPGAGGVGLAMYIDGVVHRVIVSVESVVPLNVHHHRFWSLCELADKTTFDTRGSDGEFVIRVYFEQAFECAWQGEELLYSQVSYRDHRTDADLPTLPESGADVFTEALSGNFKMRYHMDIAGIFYDDLQQCELRVKRMFPSVVSVDASERAEGDFSAVYSVIAFDVPPFDLSGGEAGTLLDFFDGASIFAVKRIGGDLHMVFGYPVYSLEKTDGNNTDETSDEEIDYYE